MKGAILFILLIYLIIRIINNMDSITKYFESVMFLILGFIPVCSGLILFDHDMLSTSDILKDTGIWFWAGICLLYTACFAFLYSLNVTLIHPKVWNVLNIHYKYEPNEWKAYILQMLLYSCLSIGLTFYLHGNFIHFIGNSLIVAISTNLLLLIMNLLFRIF